MATVISKKTNTNNFKIFAYILEHFIVSIEFQGRLFVSTETSVVGTQKNRLTEMFILSTQPHVSVDE